MPWASHLEEGGSPSSPPLGLCSYGLLDSLLPASCHNTNPWGGFCCQHALPTPLHQWPDAPALVPSPRSPMGPVVPTAWGRGSPALPFSGPQGSLFPSQAGGLPVRGQRGEARGRPPGPAGGPSIWGWCQSHRQREGRDLQACLHTPPCKAARAVLRMFPVPPKP